MTLAAARSPYPGPGELRRRRRAGRPRRPLRESLMALAERAIYAAVLLAIGAEAVPSTLGHIGAAGRATVVPINPVVEWTVVAAAVLGVVALARALLAFGPVYAGAASRTWLLSTPVDRTGLLTVPLAIAVAAGAGLAAAIGFALLLVTRLGPPPVPWLTGWAALGAAITCGCAVAQARRRPVPVLRRWLSAAGYALTAAVLAVPLLRPAVPPPALGEAGTAMQAGALALVACAAAAMYAAHRHLAIMTRGTACTGGELALAAQVSLISLDTTLFWPVVTERRLRALARVRPAGIRGNRVAALVRADVARVLRMRTGLLTWAALLPVPYAAHLAGLTAFLPAIHLVAAFLAAYRLAGGLRFIAHAPALRRALGGSDLTLKLAHLVVPAAGAVVWSAVSALPAPISPVTAAVSAAGAVAVCYRMATRPPLDHTSMVVDTGPFGPVPPDLVMRLLRGPALLAVLAVVQLAIAG